MFGERSGVPFAALRSGALDRVQKHSPLRASSSYAETGGLRHPRKEIDMPRCGALASALCLPALLTFAALGTVGPHGASAQAPARALYDFEDGEQGFAAIRIRDGAPAPDDGATATLDRTKELVRGGAACLRYAYRVEPQALRLLACSARLPAGARSFRFWVRSGAATTLVFTLREEDGSLYQLAFYVPANEWTPVSCNLDELVPANHSTDENGRLDLDQVHAIALADLATLLVNAPEPLARSLPDFKGPRQLWLDDLAFSPEALPRSSGRVQAGGEETYLVDNFETDAIRWTPVRAVLGGGAPFLELFAPETRLRILPEAAPAGSPKSPLDPGGRGLRFTYRRQPTEVFAIQRNLETVDLSRARRLRLSLNASQKSLLAIQVKEKDDSEYVHLIMPDESTGWRILDLALAELTLSDNSRDENGRLDPDQIKEITVLDASGIRPDLPAGETTLELDAVQARG